MSYDALVITAHPDDAETHLRGTLAKLLARVRWMLEAPIILEAALGKTTEAMIVAGLLGFNIRSSSQPRFKFRPHSQTRFGVRES